MIVKKVNKKGCEDSFKKCEISEVVKKAIDEALEDVANERVHAHERN